MADKKGPAASKDNTQDSTDVQQQDSIAPGAPTQTRYDECKVTVKKNFDGKRSDGSDNLVGFTFTATEVVREGTPMEDWRIKRLNDQAHNSGTYFFAEGQDRKITVTIDS